MARKVSDRTYSAFLLKELPRHPCVSRFQSFGISSLRTMQEVRHVDITLERGESLDDQCLVVRFKGRVAKKHRVPTHFRDVRVFYEDNARTVRALNKVTRMLETMARARKSIARAAKQPQKPSRTWPVENNGPHADTEQ